MTVLLRFQHIYILFIHIYIIYVVIKGNEDNDEEDIVDNQESEERLSLSQQTHSIRLVVGNM